VMCDSVRATLIQRAAGAAEAGFDSAAPATGAGAACANAGIATAIAAVAAQPIATRRPPCPLCARLAPDRPATGSQLNISPYKKRWS
jgi:hypothetical protein